MDCELKCKTQIYNILEDNTGENLDDLGYGDGFLGIIPKTQSVEEIIDKLDFIKIINICSAKKMFQETEKIPQTV